MMHQWKGSTRAPFSVFISYAHEDEPWCQQLEVHLSLLRRQGLIVGWHDHQILAGEEWARTIDEHLETASLILLLISPDFLASDYCYSIEMRRAMERHEAGEVSVIPILLRPLDWQNAPFGKLQVLPSDGRPITSWTNPDEAFAEIAAGIRCVIEEHLRVPPHSPLRPEPTALRRHTPHSRTPSIEQQNRERLIWRVRNFWITGVLEQSLHGAALMALELQEQPDAVTNPWQLIIQELEHGSTPLPIGTRITEVYDAAGNELLILGEPGAGKTTLLLELARDLLDRAEQELAHPIPVVFNLSSWAQKQQPLMTWLIEELETKYQVPRKVGSDWISADQILPLLDGLDEVDATSRRACMQAINDYHQVHCLVPLVVCCRVNEYLSQGNRLALYRAVTIQPLTAEQVNEYFARVGEKTASLHIAFQNDPVLQELATTPLMLTILVLTYQGLSLEEIKGDNSTEVRRQQIFATYTQRMLRRRNARSPYSPQQTIHWLSYLAQRMKRQNQTLFYIEHMQPDWLQGGHGQRIYTNLGVRLPSILIGILVSLTLNFFFFSQDIVIRVIFFGMLGGLLGALLSQNHAEKTTGLASPGKGYRHLIITGMAVLGMGLLMGVSTTMLMSGSSSPLLPIYDVRSAPLLRAALGELVGLVSIFLTLFVKPGRPALAPDEAGEISGRSWRSRWLFFLYGQHARNSLLVGSFMGLSGGLYWGLDNLLRYGLAYMLGTGLRDTLIGISATVILFGFLFGLTTVLVSLTLTLADRSGTILPIELLSWSWKSLRQSLMNTRHLRNVLYVGLIVGLFAGLISLLYLLSSSSPSDTLVSTTLIAVLGVVTIIATYWILFGLLQGVTSQQLDNQRRVIPNYGIHRSARNGLLFGFVAGSICSLVFSLGLTLFVVLFVGIITNLHIWPTSWGTGPRLADFMSPILLLPVTAFGLASGIIIGLLNGWLACIRHYLLRWLLWRSRSIPRNYARFLDYAAERILLRKAGGGYIFIHRLLLDYFGLLETPSSEEALAASAINDSFSVIARTPQIGTARREENASSPAPRRITGFSKEKRISISFVVVVLLIALTSSASTFSVVVHSTLYPGPRRSLPREASNLDFAAGTQSWFLAGDTPRGYAYGIDSSLTMNGKSSAYLKAQVSQTAGSGTLMQDFQGSEYRGKRLRLSGLVKAQGVEQWAGLWMRVDDDGGHILKFDNMANRPIQGTRDAKRYEVVLDVPTTSAGIFFGVQLIGKGEVWLSNVQFDVVGTDVPTTNSKDASNLDFAVGTQSWDLVGDAPQDYIYGIDPTLTLNGKPSAYIKARVPQPTGFGTLMQTFEGSQYYGKRLRLSGLVKAQGVEQWAGLWMRVDGDGGHILRFDNMVNRTIQGNRDAKRYEVVLDVPIESVSISFGVQLIGKGEVWLSDVRLDIVGTNVQTTGN